MKKIVVALAAAAAVLGLIGTLGSLFKPPPSHVRHDWRSEEDRSHSPHFDPAFK